MAQQVLHGDRTFGRNQRVGHLAVSVGLRDAHLQCRKLGQELRYRIRQLETALLHEDHRRDRDQRFGHRIDPEDRILRHRRIGRLVAEAEALEVGDLALARDQHDRAGEPALVDLLLEHLRDALQALRRQPDLFRLDRGQRAAPRDARHEDECANQHAYAFHREPPMLGSSPRRLATPAGPAGTRSRLALRSAVAVRANARELACHRRRARIVSASARSAGLSTSIAASA